MRKLNVFLFSRPARGKTIYCTTDATVTTCSLENISLRILLEMGQRRKKLGIMREAFKENVGPSCLLVKVDDSESVRDGEEA